MKWPISEDHVREFPPRGQRGRAKRGSKAGRLAAKTVSGIIIGVIIIAALSLPALKPVRGPSDPAPSVFSLVPLAPTETSNVITKTIKFHIDPTYEIYLTGGGYAYVKVGDLATSSPPGDPMVPVKTFKIELPKGSQVKDVCLRGISYMEINEDINLMITPKPLKWSQTEGGKAVAVGAKNFPGKAISYDLWEGRIHAFLYLYLYPLQYIPNRKRVILLTDADIEISYVVQTKEIVKPSFVFESENLIITHPEFYREARMLGEYHDRDVPTDVINTTWIYENYGSAEDPPYEGYNDPSLEGWENIDGYNYTLAKRIIAFLRDHPAHPDLRYVTLFGDGFLVPPSYYAYFDGDEIYNRWVPTDFFYLSPDYDLAPNYEVGRIPCKSFDEADHMVQKIINWGENEDWDWFRKAHLVGGRPFDTELYNGELVLINSVNKGYFDGMEISKLFRMEDSFDRASLLEAFRGDSGMICILTHGGGDSIATENDLDEVTAADLLSLPSNSRLPVVLSTACMNGAFDTRLYPNTPYRIAQKTSFGEAVLLSKAGGIAYIGATRDSYGVSYTYLDKGYLKVIKETYMVGMLTHVLQAYHRNPGATLGNITKEAIESFVGEDDFSNSVYNNITLFEFVLLGDPVLRLPIIDPAPSNRQPISEALGSIGYVDSRINPWLPRDLEGGEIPRYDYRIPSEAILNSDITTPSEINVTIRVETDSKNVTIKYINANADRIERRRRCVTLENFTDDTFTTSDGAALYLIRACADDGKEGWLYLTSTPITSTGEFTDWGIDEDGDDLYDYLVVEAELNVTQAGEYELEYILYDRENSSWVRADHLKNRTFLDRGVQTIRVDFDGWKIHDQGYDGSFLVWLGLYDGDYLCDSVEYETGNYTHTQFQGQPVRFVEFQDWGLDDDGDDLYDCLVIEAKLNVTQAGEYEVKGHVVCRTDEFTKILGTDRISKTLDVGEHATILKFEGWEIYESGYDGELIVDMTLTKMLRWVQCDSAEYETGNYSYDRFQGLIPDEYEPDDDYLHAVEIEIDGEKQYRNFGTPGDRDWVRFRASAGETYLIEISDLGPRCEAYLYLYDMGGVGQICRGYNGSGQASHIEWTCPSDGTYFVMVRHSDRGISGSDTFYHLSVSSSTPEIKALST